MRTNSLLAYGAVTLSCALLAVWAGCGSDSSDDTPIIGDGGASSSGTASGSSGTASGSSGTTTSSSGASGSGSSSGGSSGTASPDGGIDPPDAGPGGNTTTLTCGATTCAIPAQQCCVSQVAGGGNLAYSCNAAGDGGCPAPAGGGDVTALKCSAGANCPAGTVCCVRQTNAGAASDCKATCGQNEAQLCDKTAADAGCPQPDPCSSKDITDWGLPNTYATCGGQGN